MRLPFGRMPSGKKARQQRQDAAKRTPPPVRSKGGGRMLSYSQRTLAIAGAVLVVAIGLGVGLPLAFSSSHTQPHFEPLSTLGTLKPAPPPGKAGFEGPPLETGTDLAPAGAPAPGGSVDGIACQSGEQLLFHTHVRLTIFVDGHERAVPAGVGIADAQTQQTAKGPVAAGGACISWLHTHTTDGIIHIQSPIQRAYTLRNFFDVWGQPLSQTQVGPASGPVTAIVNGRAWVGDPGAITLTAHAQIQLEVGSPLIAPVHISSWAGL
jgi:hypothetical protein